jgi:hypothetical protein
MSWPIHGNWQWLPLTNETLWQKRFHFRLCVATFQQHLHMENLSLSWCDIPELLFHVRELLLVTKHLNSPLVFSGICVIRFLVLCVCFVDCCLSLCSFHFTIVLSVLLLFTDSDYPFGIFWPLCCLFFFYLQILITPLVSFGHCVVCSSSIYRFWLPLWYLLVIVLSVLLRYTDSDCPFSIFWSLCCLFFCDIQILIAPLVSFGHCVVCSSVIYEFCLPLWYLQTLLEPTVLSD